MFHSLQEVIQIFGDVYHVFPQSCTVQAKQSYLLGLVLQPDRVILSDWVEDPRREVQALQDKLSSVHWTFTYRMEGVIHSLLLQDGKSLKLTLPGFDGKRHQ